MLISGMIQSSLTCAGFINVIHLFLLTFVNSLLLVTSEIFCDLGPKAILVRFMNRVCLHSGLVPICCVLLNLSTDDIWLKDAPTSSARILPPLPNCWVSKQ